MSEQSISFNIKTHCMSCTKLLNKNGLCDSGCIKIDKDGNHYYPEGALLGWEECFSCGELTCDDQYVSYENMKKTEYAQFICQGDDCKCHDEIGGPRWYCIKCKEIYLEKMYDDYYQCKKNEL